MNNCFPVLATGTMGESLNQRGVKKLFVLAPNYAAGRDMVAGVKQTFKGEVVGEEYTRWPASSISPPSCRRCVPYGSAKGGVRVDLSKISSLARREPEALSRRYLTLAKHSFSRSSSERTCELHGTL